MRFDTIKDFIDKFSSCPFCKNETTKNIWHNNRYLSAETSYLFNNDSLSLFAGSKENRLINIDFSDNKINSFIGHELLPNIFGNQLKLALYCNHVSCQLKGHTFKIVSKPLHFDSKNSKVFYPLLGSYSVCVPLGESKAEYEYNTTSNKLKLLVYKYITRADAKNPSPLAANSAYSWELSNSISYRRDKDIIFKTELPFADINDLTDEQSLISKAKMCLVFS